MEFKTQRLRAAVTQAMKDDEHSHISREDDARVAYLKTVSKWNEQNSKDWSEALLGLKAKLRKGQPITVADLPNRSRYGSNYPELFDTTEPRPREHTPSPDLRVLANVLDLIEDETVTTSSLRTLGITAATLRRLAEILKSGVPK